MAYKAENLYLSILLTMLNIALSTYTQYNPRDLKEIAGHALAKKIKSISELNIPEECQTYLGLIELQEIPACTIISEQSGGRMIDGKEYLDIANTECYLSKKTFQQLIEEQNKKQLTFILAAVTTKQNRVYTHSYYNAHELNKYLFGVDADTQQRNHENPNRRPLNPRSSWPIVGEIEYFTINSAYHTKASFLGTDYDLYSDYQTKLFLSNFFKANLGEVNAQAYVAFWYDNQGNMEIAKQYYMLAASQGLAAAQNNLGIIYKNEGDMETAKYYYMLAACQGNAGAQCNLGIAYQREGNIDKAKHYYILAASQGDAAAQNGLGDIYRKEGNIKQAKYYYMLAAAQGYANAQNTLAYLYERKGKIEKAKHYYYLAADRDDKLAQFHLGEICEREGDLDQADHYYRRSISYFAKENSKYSPKQYEPTNTQDYNHCILGFICQEEGNLNKAKEHYLKAAELGNVTAQYKLGLILIEENLEEAKNI